MLPDRKRSHADSLKIREDTKGFQCLKLPAPLLQSNLGCIPMHVVRAHLTNVVCHNTIRGCQCKKLVFLAQLKDIVQLSAPTDVWQDAGCPGACPDILPVLAPCGVIAQVTSRASKRCCDAT